MTTATTLELRPFDPSRDFPPVVELMTAASTHHGVDWFPTVAGLTADWMPKPTYDPARDTIVALEGEAMVGLARTSWREREGGVVHRVEIWVRPDRLRPPEVLLPGQIPAQLARCAGVRNTVMSAPHSAISMTAVRAETPGMVQTRFSTS